MTENKNGRHQNELKEKLKKQRDSKPHPIKINKQTEERENAPKNKHLKQKNRQDTPTGFLENL